MGYLEELVPASSWKPSETSLVFLPVSFLLPIEELWRTTESLSVGNQQFLPKPINMYWSIALTPSAVQIFALFYKIPLAYCIQGCSFNENISREMHGVFGCFFPSRSKRLNVYKHRLAIEEKWISLIDLEFCNEAMFRDIRVFPVWIPISNLLLT